MNIKILLWRPSNTWDYVMDVVMSFFNSPLNVYLKISCIARSRPKRKIIHSDYLTKKIIFLSENTQNCLSNPIFKSFSKWISFYMRSTKNADSTLKMREANIRFKLHSTLFSWVFTLFPFFRRLCESSYVRYEEKYCK